MNAALPEGKRLLLERYLAGGLKSRRSCGIGRRPAGAVAPLSFEQEMLWLHSQRAPELPLYNEILTVRRTGPLEVAALERALSEVVRRHEAWRTTFEVVDGVPAQRVRPPPSFSLPVTDLSREPEREPEAARLATLEARGQFDLVRGPLIRARLVKLSRDEHRLYLTLHRIIHDGTSVYSVFLPELTALYEAFAAGRESPLPEPAIQYADFAAWQRREERPGALEASLDYWRHKLAGAPALELPADHARPVTQSFHGRQVSFALPQNLAAGLKQLSRHEGSTLFMTLLAAFEVFLHRYSGQDDLSLGTPISTRQRPEVEALLGVFLNTIVLRTPIENRLTFRQFLANVRDVTLEGLAHGQVPLHRLVQELQPRRDPGRNPLFQAGFVFEPPIPRAAPGWSLSQKDGDTGVSRLDLTLQFEDRPEGLAGYIRYNSDLWLHSTVARMVEHFQVLLEGIVTDPGRPLSAIPLLTATERTPRPARSASAELEQSIAQRFASQVAKHRHRVAVRTADAKWTYGQLNEAADRIAHALSSARIGDGARVALLLDQDAPMVAGIFGVLKSGAAYVPLDPTHPSDRLRQIEDDSLARALLISRRHRSLAAELAKDIPVLTIEELLAGPRAPAHDGPASPDSLAYLLYTSGSTGRPKGVAQNHRNVLHFIAAYANNLHISPDDRLSLLPSYSVDAAMMDIMGALLNGAALCPIDVKGGGLHGMRERLAREGVTLYHSTPTLFRQLTRDLRGRKKLRKVRRVVLGGEETRRQDVDACREHFAPDCVLVNGLGPTESTVTLQCFIGRQTKLERRCVPVGHAVERTRVSLLSRDGHEGQVYGEIAIQSPHVAVGYWQQPELTRAAFLPGPGKDRIYKTGDMGRLLPDGSLEYLGRRDLQTKIQGVRVELGEVETALLQLAGVKDAAAAVHEMGEGEKRLVAYLVVSGAEQGSVTHGAQGAEQGSVTHGAQGAAPSNEQLRRSLSARLPGQMIPSTFVRLDALPLTPSGKLDRRALPIPGPCLPQELITPRNDLEEKLAQIWKEVLGAEQLGIRDDFFDLGGHSLLALRMVAEIESRLGARVPLAALAEAPTIEQLAEVIRPDAGARPGRALVALQPAGSLPPLFGVHGHSGEVLFYKDLARHLGNEQPFYGLQSQGLAGKPAHVSIEEMAAGYLAEIRSVQPRGPYFISGFCLGALVAYEMAQRLVAQNEEVALLALYLGTPRRLSLPERLRLHRDPLQQLGGRRKLAYLFQKVRSRLRRDEGVPAINIRAMRRYIRRPYRGRMTVFLSGRALRDLGGMTAAELEVVEVPGNRDSMLHEPHVRALAGELSRILERRRSED